MALDMNGTEQMDRRPTLLAEVMLPGLLIVAGLIVFVVVILL